MTNAIPLPPHFVLSKDVLRARRLGLPIVALESAVITHGLPRPQNHALASGMEQAIHDEGATPATIALLDGKIHVGMTVEELMRIANENKVQKIGRRDLASAIFKKTCGGTTVAATLFAAHTAGLKVLATGGIGGVHSTETMDISTDLQALAWTPMIVVCAGAKAVLDLPATLEYLETMGVPVAGFQTNEFPAFYSRESGLPVSIRLDTPAEVAEFAQTHWDLGWKSAVLVCQPPPRGQTIPRAEIEGIIQKTRSEAGKKAIHGQALTPFLLRRLSELSGGETLRTNLALLLNNACLAAQISRAISPGNKQKTA
jgi:pseudouridine-5'-phosphate glycosidase